MIVAAYNPDTISLEKTYISSYQAKGVSSLPVKNNDRFIAGRRLLIGRIGDERTELVTAGTPSTDKLSLPLTTATLFDHNSDDPVYLLDWDQIRFYRRTSLTASATLQTTVDIDVDNADKVTKWDDTTALAAYYYQTSYYNSVTGDESDLSDPIQASGYDLQSIGSIVDQVVRRVRDVGFSVLGMDEYIDIANEVGNDLITQALKPYVFLKRFVALSTVAGQNYIDISTVAPDFWKYDYVELNYGTGSQTIFRERAPLSIEQFNDRYKNSSLLAQDGVIDIAFANTSKRLYLYPTPKTAQTGIVILHYYKKFTPLTKAGDIIETPNNSIYRYKLMAEYYSAKSEVDNQWAALAKKYEDKYGNEIVKMQRVNRIDVGTPRSMMPKRAYRPRRYRL